MRRYELGIVLHPNVEQTDVTQAVEQVSQYVETGGGAVTSVNVWGRRALAYPIENHQEGTYVFWQIELDSQTVGEMERKLKLDENILRYLLVHAGE